MTPEGRVKDGIKAVLKKHRAYWHMPVQNGMGSPSLDFHVCMPVVITLDMVGKTIGMYIAIEAKAPGKHMTPRQLNTCKEVGKAAGIGLQIDDPKELDSLIQQRFL